MGEAGIVSVTFERHAADLTAAVSGDLDAQTADAVIEQVVAGADGTESHVRLDLAEVAFCGSAGISAMITLHRRFGAVGATFSVANPSASVDRIIEIAGIASVIPIERASR